MKGARVFWLHVVFWVGGIVVASAALTIVPFRDCCGLRLWALGLGPDPNTVRLVQRTALALAIAAYPAGVMAARWVFGGRRGVARFALAGVLPLILLTLTLVGYGIPLASRVDHLGSPFDRFGWPSYYYLHQLPAAERTFQAQADSVARVRRPDLWAHHPELARLVVTREAAGRRVLAIHGYQRFAVAFAVLPALLALVGLLVGRWSATALPRWRRLQRWGAALILLVAFQQAIGYSAPYIGTLLFIEPWTLLERHGAGILAVPVLLLLPLAWTSLLAERRAWAPARPPAAGAPPELAGD